MTFEMFGREGKWRIWEARPQNGAFVERSDKDDI